MAQMAGPRRLLHAAPGPARAATVDEESPSLRPLRISLTECVDLAAVEQAWRALESRADASFFRSWTWVGCQADIRFNRPVLLEARWRGRVVALGLLNRSGWWLEPDTLWLGESGRRDLDAVFVEHNGLLIETGRSAWLGRRCLAALAAAPLGGRFPWRGRRVLLNGVDTAQIAAPGSPLRTRISSAQPAPMVDLAALRATGTVYFESLSANTRSQLRRSNRRYEATGPLRIERAATLPEALAYLDALALLHQQTWTRRGRPGAFANPAFLSFHRALVGRGLADGAIDLMRITARERVIGYLYNFRYRGRVCAYQSGFAYDASEPQLKPGLTCHALAIGQALSDGCTHYDFLAGDSRYKRSLANAEQTLYWVELLPPCSLRGAAYKLRRR